MVEVSVGKAHSCARLSDGTMACWGSNANNRIDGGGTPKLFPVRIEDPDNPGSPLGGIIQVDTGHTQSCALRSAGGVVCWGWNSNGRLGVNDSLALGSQYPRTGLTGPGRPVAGAVQVTTGNAHSCVLLETDEVLCAGRREEVGSNPPGNLLVFTPVSL